MTENSIKEYNSTMEILEMMIESAGSEEKGDLVNSLFFLKKAGISMSKDKRNAATALYESGSMTNEEYTAYLEYLKDFSYEQEKEVSPYMEIASLGTALTLANAEHVACHSPRFDTILATESGEILNTKDCKFLKSRVEHLACLKEDTNTSVYLDQISDGRMTDDLRNILTVAKESWDEQRVSAEKETKRYIKESIEETGSVDTVNESIALAVENGEISNFIAKQLEKVVDYCDVTSML